MSAAEGFVQFLRKTPTQFHVVRECVKTLTAAGFTRISEKECWGDKVQPSGRYFFTRNETSLFAFSVGEKYTQGNGFSIIAAHTDSPSLKLKPISKQENKGHLMLGVETYGGGKFYTWADRDLAVAGRLIVIASVVFIICSSKRTVILKQSLLIFTRVLLSFHPWLFIFLMRRSVLVIVLSLTKKLNSFPSMV